MPTPSSCWGLRRRRSDWCAGGTRGSVRWGPARRDPRASDAWAGAECTILLGRMRDGEYTKLSGGASVFIAQPSEPPKMGIVILPSMWGTTPAFEAMADSLAAEHGYAISMPEIITEARDFQERRATVATLADEAIFDTLRDAAAATGAQTVALIGFCVGGMYAMKASSLPVFDRIVAFYGMVRVPEHWQNPQQREPLDYLRQNTDRVLAIFGDRDEFIPTADMDAIEAAGVPTLRYPEAGHAFAHDPSQAHYRADDAADAWKHALSFISHGESGGD